MTIREQVIEALLKLGDSADAVAVSLKEAGITGLSNSKNCPIYNYLQKTVPGFRGIVGAHIHFDDPSIADVPSCGCRACGQPDDPPLGHIGLFVGRFDTGLYPSLKKEPAAETAEA